MMRRLAGFLSDLSTRHSADAAMTAVLRAARELLGAQGATIALREGDALRYAAEDSIKPLWKGQTVPRTGSNAVFIGDVLADASVDPERYRPTFVRSFAQAPFSRGALAVYWEAIRPPSDPDAALLEILAEALGTRLETLGLGENAERYQGLLDSDSARKRMEVELVQTHKLEGIGRLAGGIAHDFNNLLTSILGSIDFAVKGTPAGSPVRPYLQEVRSSALRAASLTRQLLAFGRKQVLQPRVFDLGDLARKSGELLEQSLREDVEVTVRVAPGVHRVHADPGQIEQVILNLAVNAREAMSSGGTLDLLVSKTRHPADSGRPAGDLPAGPYIRLTLADTGRGMDEETMSHLFEPFFTTKEVGQGSGLGLATVYGIVRQSGGQVFIWSAVARGTTVDVYLPEAGGVAEPVQADTPESREIRGTETILFVEDEESLRKIGTTVLGSLGYKVLVASNGVEALKIAAGREGTIDLLVTDVVMPKLGGRELAEDLRKRRKDLKVLFVSAYSRELLGGTGFFGPGTSFLEKPYTPKGLGIKVRRVLNLERDPSSRGLSLPPLGP